MRKTSIQRIIRGAEAYLPKLDSKRVMLAYEVARKAHADQKRESGEPFLQHPLEVTQILLRLKPDEDSIVASLLHDVLEDSDYDIEELRRDFGEGVVFLLKGLQKLESLYYRGEERQVENLRKMFLAMAKDIRVILIKLADRLHNMQTLGSMREDKRRRISEETLSVYCPIAERLGIYNIKRELEDLCFKYLYPKDHDRLLQEMQSMRKAHDAMLKRSEAVLKKSFRKAGMRVQLEVRIKQLYSVFKKLQRTGKSFAHELHDLVGLRVIVDSESQCYQALGIIHKHWTPLHHRFKDYIAKAKPNGYQSLHTTVVGLSPELNNPPIEIQIRTQEMDRIAQLGIAAHWHYKEGEGRSLALPGERIQWIRNLVELHERLKSNSEFIESLNVDLFSDRIFVLTPRGDVLDLPKGASPVDVAYAVHTDLGHRCKGAKVNGKIVALSQKLKSGEVVEILAGPMEKPNRYWLSFAVSSHARASIKQWFNAQERDHLIRAGKEMVNRQLQRFGQPPLNGDLAQLQRYSEKKMTLRNREDLLEKVGNGSVDAPALVKAILPAECVLKKPSQKELDKEMMKEVVRVDSEEILITGQKGYKTQMATCCKPSTSDPIIGYITRGRGVTIHKKECKVLKSHEPQRLIRASWASQKRPNYKVALSIRRISRIAMLRDVSNVFATAELPILDFENRKKTGEFIITFSIDSLDTLNQIIDELESIPGVFQVREVAPA